VESLRVLVVSFVECSHPVIAQLVDAGNTLFPVQTLTEATEALEIQRFDAVLLDQSLDLDAIRSFSEKVVQTTGTPTGLFWLPTLPHQDNSGRSGVLHGISELSDAASLTTAMTHLARAVGNRTAAPSQSGPVIDVEELRMQVAYDDELLAEIIDLFVGERQEYSAKLQQALEAVDFELLSRVAHTIKGSLASLHATEARLEAQALELAAKDKDAELCEALVPDFEKRLDDVQEHLLTLRRSLSGCS
jgi:HPt (histidine-containing phosphotransfer) domain-containing protein